MERFDKVEQIVLLPCYLRESRQLKRELLKFCIPNVKLKSSLIFVPGLAKDFSTRTKMHYCKKTIMLLITLLHISIESSFAYLHRFSRLAKEKQSKILITK